MSDSTYLDCDVPVVFYLRVRNLELDWSVQSLSNGFRIYSPDGATWRPAYRVDTLIDEFPPPPQTTYDTAYYGAFLPLPDTNYIWTDYPESSGIPIFDGGISVDAASADGCDADTVRFSGFVEENGRGLFTSFNVVAWSIALAAIDCPSGDQPQTLCVDSAFTRPKGAWLWSGADDTATYVPGWDGPHCFHINGDIDADGVSDALDNCRTVPNADQNDRNGNGVGDACEPCCWGIRGNVNWDGDDVIDILDLTYLVSFMFGYGSEPPCPEEADVNGVPETVDILDLTYLVAYMFQGGNQPVNCP